MNQNYVRKCEEYLQNIPSQKLPPSSSSTAGHRPGPNLSSRKLTQPGGLRQGRQSINNTTQPPPPVLPPPPAEGSRPKPKAPPPTPVPATGRRTPVRPPTARPGQLGSKFIRPCCRPKGKDTEAGRRGSDNVNQNAVRMMGGMGAGGGEGMTGKTKTWDGILMAESTVETASLMQIKSKASSPSPSEPSPITSTFPNGEPAPDSNNNHHHGLALAPNPSVTSLLSTVTSLSMRPTSSSIAAVPPQPRPPPSSVLATSPVVTEHVLQQRRQPSSTSTAKAEVNQQLQGINLFRFDPLRTLQFLTLELKSKLKPLLLIVPGGGGSGGNDDLTSAHKQLYKISKELLYAVKLLSENEASQWKETIDGKIPSEPTNCKVPEASGECQNCLKLQNVLDRRLLQVKQPCGSCLPRKEINYLQDLPQPESSKASTTDQQQQQQQHHHHHHQLQLRLEEEIKRLQTMISDKQTTTAAAAEGLINDLNRKLDEATHARDEAQRKLLYATLENERLNFLLRSQCSTMANLRHDFSAIQSLADQQIDLLDRTNEHGGLNDRSRSKSNTIATTTVTIGGNHHRNYRYPSGSAALQVAPLNPTPTTTVAAPGGQVAKLRHHRHYSFQNIAEKESDDGNDAANDYYRRRNSMVQSQQQQQQQQHRQPPQEPEVMLRLPSSTLVAEEGAFQHQQQGQERPPTTGLWQKKNQVAVAAELEQSGTSSNGSSLSVVVNAARSARFGPTKRALLIDSERDVDDDLNDEDSEGHQHQQQHSSSSLSSLTSSQQRPSRGQERRDDDDELNNNGRTTTISNRELPAFGDKPFTARTKEDDAENGSDYTNNSNHHHIQNSKTNDCVSLAPKDDEMARNQRHRQQLGPSAGSSSSSLTKKQKNDDTLPDSKPVEAKGKYPRDYGDKFERRESLLALMARPSQEEKELCQNRPIMGQIRSRSSEEETGQKEKKEEEEEVLVGKIISAANEPASGQTSRTMTRTEEFSIDFDDITLPPSPIPFRRRRKDDRPAEEEAEELPSSFGDWM